VCHQNVLLSKAAVCPQCSQRTCADCASRIDSAGLCIGHGCTRIHLPCPHCRGPVYLDYAGPAVSKEQLARVAVREQHAELEGLEGELEHALTRIEAAVREHGAIAK
jgi:hypothetical protein